MNRWAMWALGCLLWFVQAVQAQGSGGESTRLRIAGYELTGTGRADLKSFVARLGKTSSGVKVDLNDIQAVARRATEYLQRELGEVCSEVIVPEQTLERGVVKLEVVTCRLGKVTINRGNSEFGTDVLSDLLLDLRPGMVIDRWFENLVVRLRRVAGFQVSGEFRPGARGADGPRTDFHLDLAPDMLASATPPGLKWAVLPPPRATGEFKLVVEVEDGGGGLGHSLVRVNDVTVGAMRDAGPGQQPGRRSVRELSLRLPPGLNKVEVLAFAQDNKLHRSLRVDIEGPPATPQKPKLFAVVVGVDDYALRSLRLRFAAADAAAIAAQFQKEISSGSLFSGGRVDQLTGLGATRKADIVAALQRVSQEIGPSDHFVFFMASHGAIAQGEGFHLLTSDADSGDLARIKSKILGAEELQALIRNIRSTRKLVLLDACNAGRSLDAETLLSKEVDEQVVVDHLRSRSGATVLAASESIEQAHEGYERHGVFTFALLEALDQGQADFNRDKFTSTDELKMYLADRVPLLVANKWQRTQTPRPSVAGQGFNVASVLASPVDPIDACRGQPALLACLKQVCSRADMQKHPACAL